ncbi:MAG TPA: hypothetical protein VEV41_14445 [Terriglobales bacterium]|nr:hypothetical protein [Terriglobales bacterium]
MSDDDSQNRERDVRERILSFIQADRHNRRQRMTEEEAQRLKSAAGRLDQLLARIAADQQARSKQLKEEEVRALSAAAGKLDQMLTRAAAGEETELAQQPGHKKNTME